MIEVSLVDILFLRQSHLQSNLVTLAYGLDINNTQFVGSRKSFKISWES